MVGGQTRIALSLDAQNALEVASAAVRPSLLRMALRRAGNAALAEDVVQEAFLSLAERLDAGREVGDIPAFLRWTVGARLIDIQRGRPSTSRLAMRDCISLDAISAW